MKASDLLLKCLEQQGVNTIYGLPGEENADVMMSLLHHPTIQFITCTHEQTAAFMAGMHGYMTDVPGVCLATLGPGATNLMTGVAQANMDGSPLIAIVGQAETTRLHKLSHQNINAIEMFKPITKWATTILSANVIPEVIAKAFKIATSGRPGAVLIELPEDIAKCETEAVAIDKMCGSNQEDASDAQIRQFIELLQQSKKPLLFLGDGATRTLSDSVVREFLKQTQLYCAYTFMGKGVISNLYERSLHCVGLGMKDIVIQAFEEADLVICVGYSMVEWSPANWDIGVKKTIIHIDAIAAEIDEHYLPLLEMVGSIPCIMQQINAKLTPNCCKKEPYFAAIQKKAEIDIRGDADDAGFPMKPKRILKDIRDTLADADILVSDVGAHKMWIARQYGARKSKTCVISNGFCSMGGSMPGAMEAKRLYPEKNVVAVCGDGGFIMSIQALFTGVAQRIPYVVIVWEDAAYGLIQWKQEMHYHQHSHTALSYSDLVALAQSIGCHAKRVTTAAEFKSMLKWALANKDYPTVLMIPVDYSENMKLFHHLGRVGKGAKP
ncbi:MAG: acetolactate synthase large subunit [Gammaproteobacteria bacterium]|nr:acetolactate synthase large subunit [Gammaproteobacteria bacterium]